MVPLQSSGIQAVVVLRYYLLCQLCRVPVVVRALSTCQRAFINTLYQYQYNPGDVMVVRTC